MDPLQQIRDAYPEFADLPETDLLNAVHESDYWDMPREEFNAKLGVKLTAAANAPMQTEQEMQAEPEQQTQLIRQAQSAEQQPPAEARQINDFSNWRNYLYGLGGQAAQGLTFGGGDEAEAMIRSAFKPTTYEQELAAIRGENKQFAEEYPGASVAAKVAGGLPTSVLLAEALAPAAAAGGTVPVSPTIAGTALRGGIAGGSQGLIEGFLGGENGFTSRLGNSAGYGTLGAGLGTGIGAAAGSVGKLLTSEKGLRAVNWAKELSKKLWTEEAGAVRPSSVVKTEVIPQVDAADLQIINQTKHLPSRDISIAAKTLEQAAKAGGQKPIFAAEALDQRSVYDLAKLVANDPTYPEATSLAQKAIEARKAGDVLRGIPGQRERVIQAIGKGEELPSQYEGAQALQQGIAGVKKALETERSKFADPAYAAARETMPEIKTKKVMELLTEEPSVKRTIKAIRSEFSRTLDGKKWADMPDNSAEMLEETYKRLRDKALVASQSGEKQVAANYSRIADELRNSIDNAGPGFKEARNIYRLGSEKLNELFGDSKKGTGVLGELYKKDRADAEQALVNLFKMPEEKIYQVKDAFGKKWAKQFNTAVRGQLEHMISNTTEGLSVVRTLVKSPDMARRMEALLGPSEGGKFMRFLDREALIDKGNKAYFAGSPTMPLTAAKEAQKSLLGKIVDAVKSPFVASSDALIGAWDEVFNTKNAQIQTELAKRLFSTKEGAEALARIAKYREKVDPLISALRVNSQRAGNTAAILESQNLQRKD